MRPLHRLLVAALAALASVSVLAFAAAPASAQPPSLQNELFVAAGPDEEMVVDCAPPPSTSTVTFRVEGAAFGPYSGTFTEEGTATIFGIGLTLLSFESTFTIQALTGEVVTGRKTFIAPLFGRCGFFSDAHARVSYEATIRTETGTFRDTGEALATLSGRGCLDPGECVAVVFIEDFFLSSGVLPVDTTGKATGGGQILDAATQEQVSFGFEVKSTEDPNRLQGRCLVIDQASETRVKCLDVTDYEELGNTATWRGTAEVNGVREAYTITVQDNGEPNQGLDMFSIDTQSYDAAGPVEHGNVQLHKPPGAP